MLISGRCYSQASCWDSWIVKKRGKATGKALGMNTLVPLTFLIILSSRWRSVVTTYYNFLSYIFSLVHKIQNVQSADQKEGILLCWVIPSHLHAEILMPAKVLVFVVSNNVKLGYCQASMSHWLLLNL